MRKIISFLKRWSRNFAGIAILIAAINFVSGLLMGFTMDFNADGPLMGSVHSSAQRSALFTMISGVWFVLFLSFWLLEIVTSPSVVLKLSSHTKYAFNGFQQLLKNAFNGLQRILRASKFASKLSNHIKLAFNGLQWLLGKSWELLLLLISKSSRVIKQKYGKVGTDIRSAWAGDYASAGSPMLKPETEGLTNDSQPQETKIPNSSVAEATPTIETAVKPEITKG